MREIGCIIFEVVGRPVYNNSCNLAEQNTFDRKVASCENRQKREQWQTISGPWFAISATLCLDLMDALGARSWKAAILSCERRKGYIPRNTCEDVWNIDLRSYPSERRHRLERLRFDPWLKDLRVSAALNLACSFCWEHQSMIIVGSCPIIILVSRLCCIEYSPSSSR